MSRYGKAKYGRDKYGRYEINVPTGVPLSQLTRYRIRTISSKKTYSRPIVNDSITFTTNGPVKVRLRTNKGEWVSQQREVIQGEQIRLRVRSVSTEGIESSWVESVVGTIKNI